MKAVFLEKYIFYKSSTTSKRFYLNCVKKNQIFFTHVFLRVFMTKCSPPKLVFPSINQLRNCVLIVLHLGCKISIRLMANSQTACSLLPIRLCNRASRPVHSTTHCHKSLSNNVMIAYYSVNCQILASSSALAP